MVRVFTPERGDREYAFGFASGGYKRHLRALSGIDLGNQFSHLKDITRVDIGPIYSNNRYIGNTLKFDFDAKDFRRSCACDDKSACPDCFALVANEAELLIGVLSREFNLNGIPFYSGNRGIHVWVPGTEFMGETTRTNICERLTKRYGLHLDSNVTIKIAHMLKSPFSVHPSTGKIALPYPMTVLKDPAFLTDAYAYDDLPIEVLRQQIQTCAAYVENQWFANKTTV